MKWRFLKLDWFYAIGELIIVTAGVLIALAFNQWNSDRLDRIEEIQIIERLISDLLDDQNDYSSGLEILSEKLVALDNVNSIFAESAYPPDNATEFLTNIIIGANYGWNQGRAKRTTFEELLGSGKFGLIQSSELREIISAYYATDEDTAGRIEARETQYPHISYQLVLRGTDEGSDEFALDPTLNREQIEEMTILVMESNLKNYVTAEINFGRFVQLMFNDLVNQNSHVINELQMYLENNT